LSKAGKKGRLTYNHPQTKYKITVIYNIKISQ